MGRVQCLRSLGFRLRVNRLRFSVFGLVAPKQACLSQGFTGSVVLGSRDFGI